MDILKRKIAPITAAAWKEIDENARKLLGEWLSARRVVDVTGPFGWDYSSINLGRVKPIEQKKNTSIEYGIREVLPLVESRIFFELNTWELDNLERGSDDIELAPLQEAAFTAAQFEEQAVYYGLSAGQIAGLRASADSKAIEVKKDLESLASGVASVVSGMRAAGVAGPYTLVLGSEAWKLLASQTSCCTAREHLHSILGGGIILSPFVEHAFVSSIRGGDAEIVLGQDFSIGYHSHTTTTVKFFITELFTFRVLEPAAHREIVLK